MDPRLSSSSMDQPIQVPSSKVAPFKPLPRPDKVKNLIAGREITTEHTNTPGTAHVDSTVKYLNLPASDLDTAKHPSFDSEDLTKSVSEYSQEESGVHESGEEKIDMVKLMQQLDHLEGEVRDTSETNFDFEDSTNSFLEYNPEEPGVHESGEEVMDYDELLKDLESSEQKTDGTLRNDVADLNLPAHQNPEDTNLKSLLDGSIEKELDSGFDKISDTLSQDISSTNIQQKDTITITEDILCGAMKSEDVEEALKDQPSNSAIIYRSIPDNLNYIAYKTSEGVYHKKFERATDVQKDFNFLTKADISSQKDFRTRLVVAQKAFLEELQNSSYNQGKLSSEKAEQKLQKSLPGKALIREDPKDGQYYLSIKIGNKVEHRLISEIVGNQPRLSKLEKILSSEVEDFKLVESTKKRIISAIRTKSIGISTIFKKDISIKEGDIVKLKNELNLNKKEIALYEDMIISESGDDEGRFRILDGLAARKEKILQELGNKKLIFEFNSAPIDRKYPPKVKEKLEACQKSIDHWEKDYITLSQSDDFTPQQKVTALKNNLNAIREFEKEKKALIRQAMEAKPK